MQPLQFQEVWITVMCFKYFWNKLSINFQTAVLFRMTCLTRVMNFTFPGIFLQRLFNLILRLALSTVSRQELGGPARRKNWPSDLGSQGWVWNLGLRGAGGQARLNEIHSQVLCHCDGKECHSQGQTKISINSPLCAEVINMYLWLTHAAWMCRWKEYF